MTIRPLPALSVYTASKAALNAFTESFALEAAEFGIRARLVMPGSSPETSFARNGISRMGMTVPEPYESFVQEVFTSLRSSPEKTTTREVVEAVWRAVT